MDRLPREVLDIILQDLPRSDLTSLRFVGSFLHDAVSSLLFREVTVRGTFRQPQLNILKHPVISKFVKRVDLRDISKYTDVEHAMLHGLPHKITLDILVEKWSTSWEALANLVALHSDCFEKILLRAYFDPTIHYNLFIVDKIRPLLCSVDHLHLLGESWYREYASSITTFLECFRHVQSLVLEGHYFGDVVFSSILAKRKLWPALRSVKLHKIVTTGENLVQFFRINSTTLRAISLIDISYYVTQDESTEDAPKIGFLETIQMMAENLQLQQCAFQGTICEGYVDGIEWHVEGINWVRRTPGKRNRRAGGKRNRRYAAKQQKRPTRSATDSSSKNPAATCLYTAVIDHVIRKTAWPFPPRETLTDIARAWRTSRLNGGDLNRDHAWLYGDCHPELLFIFGDKSWKGMPL